MTSIGELFLKIVVNSETASKELAQTNSKIQAVGDTAKNTGESIRKYLDTALSSLVKTALPIATVTGAMVALSKAQSELVEVGKQAEATGIPVEDLQAWGRAADSLGYSAEDAKRALVSIQEGMQEAALTGQGKMAGMLNYLGIRLKDTNGNIRNSSDLMKDLSKRFSSMSQSKAFYLGKMMGLTPDTIALLRKGKVLTDELAESYKHVHSAEDIEKANQFKLAIGAIQTAGEDFAKNLLVAVAPALTTALNALMPIVQIAADNPFATLATAGALAFRTLSAAIMSNPIGIAIAGLTVAFADFFNFLNGADSMTGNFLEWLGISEKSIEEFKQSVLGVVDSVKDFFGFGDESKKQTAIASSPSSVYNGGNSSVSNRTANVEVHNEINVSASGNTSGVRDAVTGGVNDAMSDYQSAVENAASGVSY